MSTLNVNTIANLSGTTAATIDSSGVITHAAGLNNYATATGASGASVNPTLTGIPSWASEITVAFFDLSGTTSTDTFHRVAVGGSVITTGYQYVTTYVQNSGVTIGDRSAAGDTGFAFWGWTNQANNFNGTLTYTRTTGNKYVVQGNHYNHGYTTYSWILNGRISLSGPISGISLYNSSTFDSGEVRVVWR